MLLVQIVFFLKIKSPTIRADYFRTHLYFLIFKLIDRISTFTFNLTF